MPKPQPVPQTVVCSECGLKWELHKKATLAECIRLLRAELATRPQMSWTNGSLIGSGSATVTTLNAVGTTLQPKRDVA